MGKINIPTKKEINKMTRKKDIIKDEKISEYFGRSPRIKILEFLINNKEDSFGIKEIIKYAKVKHRNLIEVLSDLIKGDVIYIEKTLGKSNLYKINEFEPFVQSLMFAMEIYKK